MIRGISAQKRLLSGFSSGFERRLYYNVLCDSLILAVMCLASNLLLLLLAGGRDCRRQNEIFAEHGIHIRTGC